MAESARPVHRAASSLNNAGLHSRVFLLLDLLIILSVLAAAVVVFWLYEDFRVRAYTALGYGWVPVALWGLAVVATLRYRPRWLFRPWNWWLAGAGLAALAVGTLSFFDAGYGALAFASLGGHWGSAMVGESQVWGIARLLAIALIIPLLLSPRKAGQSYGVVLFTLGKGIWYAAYYLWRGTRYLARLIGRGVRTLCNGETRPRWITAVLHLPGRLFITLTGKLSRRAVVDADADAVPENIPASKAAPAPPTAPVNMAPVAVKGSQWGLPPVDLLAPVETHEADDKPLKKMAENIESALADHGVSVEVTDIKSGPRIVRFGLMPGWVEKNPRQNKDDSLHARERRRVQVGSIMARERDLALAISAPSLRFEQSSGEALLGLELPTPMPSKVTMREVMDSQGFRKITGKGGLPIALGADTGGEPVAMDLSALPHMMIAGSTGSGKSVCINSIIASFLMTKPPDQLRMLMVDPKQVELTPFNGIPHLVVPVIKDVDDVSPMLKGLVREMNRRYKAMSEIGVRNIAGYNGKSKDPMPYLVLIVDELADLMMVGGQEVEHSLMRLAQMGRASGIHLVLATQRPSKQVVTGLLKANIPAKVSFAVANQVDSRVVLDSVGAEKLLGKGDMLLLNNDNPRPRRVQGTLVLDEEIEELVGFWLEQKGPPLPVISLEDAEDGEEDDDEDAVDETMLEKARELALRNPSLTSSLLERRLKIGGSRAAQIVERLEEEGLLITR